MEKMKLFLPITKVDVEKGIVYGVLAKEQTDRSGEIFDYAGSKPYFEKWSESVHKATDGKSFGNLRSMHGQVAAGKFTQMVFNDDDQQIEVAAKVVDPVELNKVVEGVYTGFSIGGKYVTRKKEGDVTRYVADPYEGSLVDLPCIPDATFSVIKAEGAQPELRKFQVEAPVETEFDPANDDLVARAQKLAAAAKTEKWLDFIEKARAELKAEHVGKAARTEPKHELPLAVTAIDEAAEAAAIDGLDKGAIQRWTHPDLPGESFAKRGELRDALVAKAAADKAKALSGPAADALKALGDAVDSKAGKKAEAADDGDGKDKKTGKDSAAKEKDAEEDEDVEEDDDEIDDPKKLAAAVKAEAAKAVPSFARRARLIVKAHALKAVDAIPGDWGMGDAVRKDASWGQVTDLISLVSQMERLRDCLERAGDNSYYYTAGTTRIEAPAEIMAKLKASMGEFGDLAASLLDAVLAAMKGDAAAKMLAGGGAPLHKIAGTTDEAGGEIADLRKQLSAQEATFKATLEKMTDGITKIAETVKRIEAQPMPEGTSHFRVVGKGEQVVFDGGAQPDDQNRAAFAEMMGDLARLNGTKSRSSRPMMIPGG